MVLGSEFTEVTKDVVHRIPMAGEGSRHLDLGNMILLDRSYDSHLGDEFICVDRLFVCHRFFWYDRTYGRYMSMVGHH